MATQEQPPTNSSQSSIEDGAREEGVHLHRGDDGLFTVIGIVDQTQPPRENRVSDGISHNKFAKLGPDFILHLIQSGNYLLTKHRPQE